MQMPWYACTMFVIIGFFVGIEWSLIWRNLTTLIKYRGDFKTAKKIDNVPTREEDVT